MSRHVAVVGAGAWGTALCHVLASAGNTVRLWAFEEEVVASINEGRENTIYLPGHHVNEAITASNDIAWVVGGAELIVSVSPSQVVGRVMAAAAPHMSPDAIVVSASKGIELHTHRMMHQVLGEVLPEAVASRIAVISGPSFAAEVANSMPTAVSVACADHGVAEKIQIAFSCEFFRVYAIDDVPGAEIGGALKNVIALAAGICDGMGFGHNSRAALITRGLAEIGRLGNRLGARTITFMGLSGLGDLVLTCNGDLSRNRTVGMRLGKGEALDDIINSMTAVAEGVKTCEAAVELAREYGVEMPICEKVYEIVHDGKPATQAVSELMGRPIRREFAGLEGVDD